jgi:hypothetical protein
MAEVNTLFTFVIPQEKSGAGLALKFGKFWRGKPLIRKEKDDESDEVVLARGLLA